MYRHAMWAPTQARPAGYLYGAPLALFREAFARLVRELGVPLLVWDHDPVDPVAE